MNSHILLGPFLTRAAAAEHGHVPIDVMTHRPDLLRLGGRWLQEVYFEFQFDQQGVRPDVGAVVQELKRSRADRQIAEWLVHPHRGLGYATPLEFLNAGGACETVLALTAEAGPELPAAGSESMANEARSVTESATLGSPPGRGPRRRHLRHRPLLGN